MNFADVVVDGTAVDCADVFVSALVVGLFVVFSCVVGPSVNWAAAVVTAFVVGFLVVCSCDF